jgi:hypothetical protein
MLIKQGQTTNFVVYYDDALVGNPQYTQPSGSVLAQSVLDHCENDLTRLSMIFGGVMPPHLPLTVNLIVGTQQNGPIVSNSNDGVSTINIAVAYNASYPDTFGPNPVVVVEEAEIFMNAQNRGWIPGWSAGEGLSRVFGGLLYPSHAWLVACGNSWFTPATHSAPADWVDNVEPTDGHDVSYGCSSLFLNYLAYQLNYTWPAIVGAGAPQTNALAETAQKLGAPGYAAFLQLLKQYFPTGNLATSVHPGLQYTDDVYPLGPAPSELPALYLRHNLADDGTSHSGTLGSSPDIIVKNAEVPNAQAIYSTPASIASDTESDPYVVDNVTNYVYVRAWNRGATAQNAFASVYWSPPSTLVTPPMWNLIGTSYFPELPVPGQPVQVSMPGIPWPASAIPTPGHYCFVATLGNNYQPAPNPEILTLAGWNDYVNFIYQNNNVTWRNFNVMHVNMGGLKSPIGGRLGLPFHLAGAWDVDTTFTLEVLAGLPRGSALAIQGAESILRDTHSLAAEKLIDSETDPDRPHRLLLELPPHEHHVLGVIHLPADTIARSHLLVHIPPEHHDEPVDVAVRQLYEGKEVGRITWRLIPTP